MPNPTTLSVPLNASLAGTDPSGAVTLTANGPVRYRNFGTNKGYWSEEAATNLVTNPLFHVDTFNWIVGSGSLDRSTAWAYMGTASGLVTATGVNASTHIGVTLTVATHALSMVIRNNAASVRTFQLRYANVSLVTTFDRVDPDTPVPAGVAISGNGVSVPAGAVVRLMATATGIASAQYAGVICTNSANTETFNVGHFQVEAKNHATSPVPVVSAAGAIQSGYTWSGAAHASTSTRAGAIAYIARGTKYTIGTGAVHLVYTPVEKMNTGSGVLWYTGGWYAGADWIGVYVGQNDDLYFDITYSGVYSADIAYPVALVKYTTYDIWAWWTPTTAYLQINGGTIYSATRTGTANNTFDTNNNVCIGGSGQESNGLIRDVATFNRPLTANEKFQFDNYTSSTGFTAMTFAKWEAMEMAIERFIRGAVGVAGVAGTGVSGPEKLDIFNRLATLEAENLGSHNDTLFTSLASGQVPTWDGTKWVNQSVVQGLSAVKSNNVSVVAPTASLDFSTAFAVTSEGSGEAGIAPVFGTAAGQVAEGNHAHNQTLKQIARTHNLANITSGTVTLASLTVFLANGVVYDIDAWGRMHAQGISALATFQLRMTIGATSVDTGQDMTVEAGVNGDFLHSQVLSVTGAGANVTVTFACVWKSGTINSVTNLLQVNADPRR